MIDLWTYLRRLATPYRILDSIRLISRMAYRYPLRHEGCLQRQPLFIIGSGRSGNTLLRAMLVAQGDISIPPESYVLGAVIREFYRYNFLPWFPLSRLVISAFESHPQFYTWNLDLGPVYQRAQNLERKNLACLIDIIYRHYLMNKHPQAIRWGDKTPMNTLHLDEIHKVFPEAQYIHIIRDGRDVVASYLRANLYDNVEEAARFWVRCIILAQKFGKQISPAQYLEVRYEQLVQSPAPILKKVCEFLGITYKKEMLRFYEIADKLGDTVQPHHHNIHNPLTSQSVGKWRQVFTSTEQRKLHHLLAPVLDKLGYLGL